MIAPVWVEIKGGYRIKIDSNSTLQLFTDIFVNHQYAVVFDLLNSPNLIIDLGANRGLFFIYACYELEHRKLCSNFTIICVEPEKHNYGALLETIVSNKLTKFAKPVFGAVSGRRDGFQPFFSMSKYHVSGKITQSKRLTTTQVPIINLSQYIDSDFIIDLMKVDIEGSEEAFLREYQDILQRTKILIVEFHHDDIDYDAALESLSSSGFVFQQRTYEFSSSLTVEIFINSKLG